MGLINKIFGSHSQRELKRIYPIVDNITALEDKWKKLSDEELKAKTEEFKSRLSSGETLDDILPEAFATVREAADRVLPLPCAACRRYCFTSGQNSRNEDRRRQNFGCNPSCLP